MTIRPFHLAFAVDDLSAARDFYVGVLGCGEGRTGERWADFDLYGHQITVHLSNARAVDVVTSEVDGHPVPIPHFGVVLAMPEWRALADRLTAAGTKFGIAPYTRFAGEIGEQSTMFFRDPAGNALEFKGFADDAGLFAR